MKNKYYAIRKGHRSCVVVQSWDECKTLTDGCPGAIFKGFPAHELRKANQFAKYGSHKGTSHKPQKPSWNNDLYPCIERKDYRDTTTGVLNKNRCIRRAGPTVIGESFKPHIGNSVPWRA
jgi:hypothetical protein